LAVLFVGGAAFAAVGGAEAVKELFLNVRIVIRGIDGEAVEATVDLEQVEGEEGAATGTIDLGDGGQATLELMTVDAGDLTGADGLGGEEMKMMTVSLSGTVSDQEDLAAERTIELLATMNTGDGPIEQTDILEQIAEAELVVPWTDGNGDDRELYIVREYGEDDTSVLKLFGSRWNQEGDEVFDMLGMVTQLDSPIVEAPTIEFHEGNLTSLTVRCEDGEERTIRFDADGTHLEGESATVHITIGGMEEE
jgi:hypothetical protein